jgi:methylthioribose-1-phosphate isomerase
MPIDTITWSQGRVTLIDQTRLPMQVVYLHPETVQEMWQAIRSLQVRGAPAIGIAAAFGVYLAAVQSSATSVDALLTAIDAAVTYLASARPTAVNLFWALQRIQQTAHSEAKDKNANVNTLRQALLNEARQMIDEDNAVCLAIGQHGLSLLRPNMGLLTHCNAGGLGTAGWGTALAPIYLAHQKGWPLKVFADETRPVLQGARLTAWELQTAGIDVTLICDNMAGLVMQQGWVQAVIVGCDRVSANGDTVNKIGTYSLAILAQHHGIPFYVAAPRSSIDLATAQGNDVVIEERDATEVTEWCGQRSAPPGVKVYNPAFDVTPAELISAYITEVGVLKPPFPAALAKACAAAFTGPKHV